MRRALLIALALAAGCTSGSGALVLLTLGSDGPVDQFDLYVRDDASRTVVLHTGWINFNRDVTTAPVVISLEPPGPGSYSIVVVGAKGAVAGNVPAKGSAQFFWAGTVAVDGQASVTGQLLPVPDGDDQDRDVFPDAVAWVGHVPDASAIPLALLDCDDKTDYPAKKVFAAQVNPFAPEICGDAVDEDCNGDSDEPCVDRDNDGDPDSSDCKPDDPKIHHPITDPSNPHYDPYPQSPNCCGYNLGKSGADANKPFNGDPTCHLDTCGDGIDEDCSGKDIPCFNDQDCDQFRAKTVEDDGCTAPPDKDQASPNLDCDDCNAAINPLQPEICDGLDNNCNGLTDETCLTCDLDGDGYQRSDAQNGCPDANYVKSGKPLDCDDEDTGVFPGSTGASYPARLPYLMGNNGCGGTDGGTVCGALRGLCRNVKTDGTTPQDANCDAMPRNGCPPANCDADGDGFIDAAQAATCDPKGQLAPYDCDDADPHTFPDAPSLCGETMPHNCTAIANCAVDADADGYDSNHDCNDADKTVHPWATEVCDGVDNDCDGLTDEGNPDETGKALIDMGHVTYCSDSNTGLCALPPVGHCVCSAFPISSLFIEQAKRNACPGEDATVDAASGSKARCYGAHQPGPQSCNPMMPVDDDCDGRTDAPDGKNFPQVGMNCWPGAVGACKPTKGGKITACDQTKTNCFAGAGVNPWLVCDNSEICPTAEKCNGFDDDCNGSVPVNETDVDGDGYAACGSAFPMYTSGQQCEATLANGLVGCGDCADAIGLTMGVNNNQIHPGQNDLCDGVDNDCNPASADGATDCPGPKPAEICCGQNGCKDPANDINNCNGCGMVCSTPNAVPICSASTCAAKSCNAPFADCDNIAVNGCEVNTNTDPTHCGGCANNCSNNNIAAPTCAAGMCSGACNPGFLDCNGNKLTDGCEANTATDPAHCGGCASACSNNNIAVPTCVGSACNGMCNGGFLDCDGNKLTNGCEVNGQTDSAHCGGCANVCSNNNIAAPTCTGGSCTGNCTAGFADCDGNKLANGCEINTTTDVNHCGGCANVCSGNNIATRSCGASQCNGTCNAGFFDCDGSKLGNGCELDGRTDPNNCGGCAVSCSGNNMATRTCSAQLCSGNCNAGFFDCNGNKLTDGCEINSQTDPNNCGGCSINCSNNNIAAPMCAGGSCSGTCNNGFADCDGNKLTNGCEINFTNDANHCGGCANVCSNNHIPVPTCSGSMCIGNCAGGFADCDGNKLSNGCEINFTNDTNNCSGCGVHCSAINMATIVCSGSACTGTCNPGFFDCDGSKQVDGCETDGRSDITNCGGCSVMCSGNHMATVICTNQVCNGACAAGFFDCDGSKQTDGCEINTTNDPNNCGGCSASCSNNNMATRTCGGGICNGMCTVNFADCDGNKQTDGCEINTATDANNCGACGTHCAGNNNGHVCVNSNCACNVAGDCNATIANACAGNTCKCGAGAQCNPATQQCVAGTCKLDDGQGTCVNNSDCVNNHCQAQQNGMKICAAVACGTCQVINSLGTSCVLATDGTDPKVQCGGSNAGHTCVGGACGCQSSIDCPNGTAPGCFGNICGCGSGGTICSGNSSLCTTFDNSGQCKARPGGSCMTPSDCAAPGSTCMITCMGLLPGGSPCINNSDCNSGACINGKC